MKTFKVYLAGPINGLTYEASEEWRAYIAKHAPDHVQTYTPMRGKEFLNKPGNVLDDQRFHYSNQSPDHHYDHPLLTPKAILSRDFYDVRSSDVIIANLTNTSRVSIGTVMEIAWAYQAQIPVILIIEPIGEASVHHHPMVMESANFIVHTLWEAVDVLKAIV